MEDQITTGQTIKKWGVIYGAIVTLVTLVPMILDYQTGFLIFVNMAVAIGMYVLAMKEFKTENSGLMSFGEGFKMAFGMAAIAGVMRGVVSYVYMKFIDPEYSERALETVSEDLRAQGLAEEQIEQTMSFTAGLSNPEVNFFATIISLLLGALIIGAIVSAIMKNQEDEF
jgi:hypothetical protein